MTPSTPVFDTEEFGLTPDDFDGEAVICDTLEAAGGLLIGRIRLQKTIYLLSKMGMAAPFSFIYHHYGPYSADLANALDFSVGFGMVDEIIERRKSDGARFSKFRLKAKPKSQTDFFNHPEIITAISTFTTASSTVLELAATIYWLKHDENCLNWHSEIIRRKGVKTEEGRLGKAEKLLETVGLAG